MRHRKGGHDVPEGKIRERRQRSFDQLAWFFDAADRAFILNNSGASLHTVATKDEESVSIEGAIIPEIMDALLRSLPELKALLEQNAADVKASD